MVDYAIRTTNVPAVNDPPVCEPNAVPTTTGVVTYFGRCYDDERAKQTLVLVRAPTKGTASLGGGSFAFQFFTYRARTAGSDTFTAKSSDGTQESNALTFNITNPGTPAATQSPSIAGKRNGGTLRVSAKGRFTFRGQLIDCPGTGPNCAVAARVTTRRKQKRARSAAKRKTTTLARSSFTVKARRKGVVKLRLTRSARRALARRKRIAVKVNLRVRRGSVVRTKTVTATLAAPRRRR